MSSKSSMSSLNSRSHGGTIWMWLSHVVGIAREAPSQKLGVDGSSSSLRIATAPNPQIDKCVSLWL